MSCFLYKCGRHKRWSNIIGCIYSRCISYECPSQETFSLLLPSRQLISSSCLTLKRRQEQRRTTLSYPLILRVGLKLSEKQYILRCGTDSVTRSYPLIRSAQSFFPPFLRHQNQEFLGTCAACLIKILSLSIEGICSLIQGFRLISPTSIIIS